MRRELRRARRRRPHHPAARVAEPIAHGRGARRARGQARPARRLAVTSVVQGAGRWYTEFLTPHLSFSSRILRLLLSGKTAFQSVELLETGSFGRTLLLDGKTQSTAVDQHVYHESLVQPAMLMHSSPRT
ncbi:MAG: hypothetical protein FJ315_00740, partial [SAR202 cluster bacterium]|nr:hypothetical protein [SAR202 cluster bacterium]